jgi:hypothetical protein
MTTGSDKIIEFQEMLVDRKSLKNINYIKVDREKYIHDHVNSLNYRGLEFDNNEILTLGCSQTWGYAMDYEFLWPTLIMNRFKKNVSNIAVPGDSLQAQIIKAFTYFKEIGNPKIIIGVLPFARFEFPYIKNKMIFQTMQPHVPTEKMKSSFIANAYVPYTLDKYDTKITYTKTPHILDEIFTIEMAMFYNDSFIAILEQYCKANDIKIIWTFWENLNPPINKLFINSYDGYFQINRNMPQFTMRQIKTFKSAPEYNLSDFMGLCKDDYFSSLIYKNINHECILSAKDKNHFGILDHIFIADAICDQLKNRFGIE